MTSDEQQLILELINRARANPSGEFDELIPSGVGLTTEIESALNYFGVDLSVLASQLDDYDAVAPLAFNANLEASATAHNELMLEYEQQSHNLPDELGLGDRIEDAGYENWSALGESVFAYAQDPVYAHAGFYIDWGNTSTGIQDPAGHRNSILSASYTEVGIAWAEETDPDSTLGPYVTTQHFGNSFTYEEQLLGVVFDDHDGDDFYGIGEGLGAISITVFGENGTFVTTSWDSGGYQLVVPDGVYTVIFDGSGLGGIITTTFTMAAENTKVDAIAVNALNAGVDLTGFDGNDEMIGTSLGDTLSGAQGDDEISGGKGSDTLDGGDGIDYLYGGTFSDNILGGDGKDKIFGGNGNDVIDGENSGDRIYGHNGDDEILGGSGNDRIYGGNGGDYLDGGGQHDWLFGGAGDDDLYGKSGNDTLTGGTGDDDLRGGTGSDVFVFSVGDDSDTIKDFDAVEDTIQISSALANGQTAQQIVDGASFAGNGSIILDFGSGDQILLNGFTDGTALVDAILIDL